MTGWNMPPGCTEGMIPGNRQIDIEIEKLFDELDGMIVTFLNESDHVDKADIPQVLRDLLTQYERENQENRCRYCGEIPEDCECSRGGKREQQQTNKGEEG
jgi:hypothetical protein